MAPPSSPDTIVGDLQGGSQRNTVVGYGQVAQALESSEAFTNKALPPPHAVLQTPGQNGCLMLPKRCCLAPQT